MSDAALGTIETLVAAFDEIPEDLDLSALPEEVASILNYINVQCRNVASAPGESRHVAALRAIAGIGGNLPDDRLTDKTGPNDAERRGLMYVEARRIANEALSK